MRVHRLLLFAVAALVGLALCGALSPAGAPGALPAAAEEAPDFVKDVQPILAVACVRCHSAALPQGQLRLDTREGLAKGGAAGPVLAGRDAAASSLYARLVLADPVRRMPLMSEPLRPGRDRDPQAMDRGGGRMARGSDRGHGLGARAGGDSGPRLGQTAGPFSPPLQPRRAADPGRQLLRVPRPRPQQPADGPAPRPRGGGEVDAGLGHHRVVCRERRTRARLIARILDPDESRRMPHVSSGQAPAHSRPQVATLRRWIEEGAEWEPHWSYLPLRGPRRRR